MIFFIYTQDLIYFIVFFIFFSVKPTYRLIRFLNNRVAYLNCLIPNTKLDSNQPYDYKSTNLPMGQLQSFLIVIMTKMQTVEEYWSNSDMCMWWSKLP